MGNLGELLAMGLILSSGSAQEISHRLERLRTPLRVLYVAAHPDDENTQLLAWLARGKKVKAAYLSLTRGDGGQNLIGKEQRPLLGVIRTHELLAARRLDGAAQFFTSLRDFGYSKSSTDTLKRWGRDKALEQVVRVYRSFRPHVVVTRFPEEGPTHGHHLASAQLARLAMEPAEDATRYPEHGGQGLGPWKVQRLFYNFPHFWASRGKEPPKGPKYEVDVGGFDSWTGQSLGEISGRSRSMHKSQGFGASARHGPWLETLVLLAGSAPSGDDPWAELELTEAPFSNPSWLPTVKAALAAFRGDAPASILPILAQLHRLAEGTEQVREVEALMVEATGLLGRAVAKTSEVLAGSELEIEVELLARSSSLGVHRIAGLGTDRKVSEQLQVHRPWKRTLRLTIPASDRPTQFPWLDSTGGGPRASFYQPSDAQAAIYPTQPSHLALQAELEIEGVRLQHRLPVQWMWVDPVLGERTTEVVVTVPVSVQPSQEVVWAVGGRAAVEAIIQAADDWEGEVGLQVPGRSMVWKPVRLKAGRGQAVQFDVDASKTASAQFFTKKAGFKRSVAFAKSTIDHPHLPRMTVQAPASVRLVSLSLSIPTGPIGYIPGSGDVSVEVLSAVGARVQTIGSEMGFDGFESILVGIRAFNVNDALVASRDRLMEWVERGGTLVVQYNTKNWSATLDTPIGPYPITIHRGRVTDEAAPVEWLVPKHPVLNQPNRLTQDDFADWVQERGLYFAESWDERYTPLFSMADPGEEAQKGSTLVAKFGRGAFVFTGLSLFRQLPAGRPGALRLLCNFLSLRGSDL